MYHYGEPRRLDGDVRPESVGTRRVAVLGFAVEDDLAGWKEAAGDKPTTSFTTYEALNHHFMPGTDTPGRMEYLRENHADQQVIADVATFVE